MDTSGTAAKATTNNDPVVLITITNAHQRHRVHIVNEGTAKGFWSPDGGTTWSYLPAGDGTAAGAGVVVMSGIKITGNIMIKRVADGTDLSGVYGTAW